MIQPAICRCQLKCISGAAVVSRLVTDRVIEAERVEDVIVVTHVRAERAENDARLEQWDVLGDFIVLPAQRDRAESRGRQPDVCLPAEHAPALRSGTVGQREAVLEYEKRRNPTA
ncbi:hypothetical protein NECAME_18571 [Necator americanus]|uniref:Uncharacterized protein n=1 Tax=Necator americanus TaxID=51031 RepID=W2STN8_NECAM|nr:hypothetical protein NECAME_18571 [Necator americanus]ETN72995.1 hypothetical protein NECAME_18571 [Necator americanus]